MERNGIGWNGTACYRMLVMIFYAMLCYAMLCYLLLSIHPSVHPSIHLSTYTYNGYHSIPLHYYFTFHSIALHHFILHYTTYNTLHIYSMYACGINNRVDPLIVDVYHVYKWDDVRNSDSTSTHLVIQSIQFFCSLHD